MTPWQLLPQTLASGEERGYGLYVAVKMSSRIRPSHKVTAELLAGAGTEPGPKTKKVKGAELRLPLCLSLIIRGDTRSGVRSETGDSSVRGGEAV
ncbi:unnamed protein product [Merluccius merluccius]